MYVISSPWVIKLWDFSFPKLKIKTTPFFLISRICVSHWKNTPFWRNGWEHGCTLWSRLAGPGRHGGSHRGSPTTLQWRHNGFDGVSTDQPHHCLLNRLFGRRWKKTSKFRVTGLCAGNSPGTGKFPAQMASNAENVSIRWRYHEIWSQSHHGCCRCLAKQALSHFQMTKWSETPNHISRDNFYWIWIKCHSYICIEVAWLINWPWS